MKSKLMARQSVQAVIPTHTKGRALPRLLAVLAVLGLMLASAGAAFWLTLQHMSTIDLAAVQEAEAAAFSAGRVTAMAEMSNAMADVYQQGRSDALADLARGAAVSKLGEVRP